MKPASTFGMLFRFHNAITRDDAAFMLRMVRRRTRPLVTSPHAYFFDGFILSTR